MLFDSKQFKQNIMLRANSHAFSNLVHLGKHVDSEELRAASRLLIQTGKDGDERSLSSTVVAQKAENLISVHF